MMVERNNADWETSEYSRDTAQQVSELNIFAMLKPSLQKDGNQWCVLYGENLQSGIAGFGDSPHAAVMDFNINWCKSI